MEKLKDMSSKDRNWSSSSVPVILFLRFADLHKGSLDDLEFEAHDSDADVCATNTS